MKTKFKILLGIPIFIILIVILFVLITDYDFSFDVYDQILPIFLIQVYVSIYLAILINNSKYRLYIPLGYFALSFLIGAFITLSRFHLGGDPPIKKWCVNEYIIKKKWCNPDSSYYYLAKEICYGFFYKEIERPNGEYEVYSDWSKDLGRIYFPNEKILFDLEKGEIIDTNSIN